MTKRLKPSMTPNSLKQCAAGGELRAVIHRSEMGNLTEDLISVVAPVER
jgi:hypothetical protein